MTAIGRRLAESRYGRWAANRAKRVRQRLAAPGRRGPDAHLFVAGVQRSGTNMLMEALERSPDTDVYHESDARAFADYEMRSVEQIERLVAACPAPLFVIKALCELQDLPGLMERFSPSRTVWIYRDYRDVANSMTVSFSSVPATVRQMAQDPEGTGWWARGMSADTRELLARGVERGPNAHTSAALLWYARNRLLFELGMNGDPRVLVVRYEDLVTDPRTIVARVAGFAGLPFDARMVAGIHSRSIGRRPRPELDPVVAEACDALMARLADLEHSQARADAACV